VYKTFESIALFDRLYTYIIVVIGTKLSLTSDSTVLSYKKRIYCPDEILLLIVYKYVAEMI